MTTYQNATVRQTPRSRPMPPPVAFNPSLRFIPPPRLPPPIPLTMGASWCCPSSPPMGELPPPRWEYRRVYQTSVRPGSAYTIEYGPERQVHVFQPKCKDPGLHRAALTEVVIGDYPLQELRWQHLGRVTYPYQAEDETVVRLAPDSVLQALSTTQEVEKVQVQEQHPYGLAFQTATTPNFNLLGDLLLRDETHRSGKFYGYPNATSPQVAHLLYGRAYLAHGKDLLLATAAMWQTVQQENIWAVRETTATAYLEWASAVILIDYAVSGLVHQLETYATPSDVPPSLCGRQAEWLSFRWEHLVPTDAFLRSWMRDAVTTRVTGRDFFWLDPLSPQVTTTWNWVTSLAKEMLDLFTEAAPNRERCRMVKRLADAYLQGRKRREKKAHELKTVAASLHRLALLPFPPPVADATRRGTVDFVTAITSVMHYVGVHPPLALQAVPGQRAPLGTPGGSVAPPELENAAALVAAEQTARASAEAALLEPAPRKPSRERRRALSGSGNSHDPRAGAAIILVDHEETGSGQAQVAHEEDQEEPDERRADAGVDQERNVYRQTSL